MRSLCWFLVINICSLVLSDNNALMWSLGPAGPAGEPARGAAHRLGQPPSAQAGPARQPLQPRSRCAPMHSTLNPHRRHLQFNTLDAARSPYTICHVIKSIRLLAFIMQPPTAPSWVP